MRPNPAVVPLLVTPLLVAPLLVTVVLTACSGEPGAVRAEEASGPVGATSGATSGGPPDGWRTETWAGLSVDVPDEWGYTGAPARFPGGEVLVCADWSPLSTGDGEGEPPGAVGRPVLSSDVCWAYPWIANSPAPTAPYVWLGGEVEAGTVRYAGGFVQETVVRQGTTLTVATDDPALRERILDSARPATPCGETPPAVDVVEVCGYDRDRRGTLVLAHAASVEPGVLAETEAAARAAARAPEDAECRAEPGDRVVLRSAERRVVVDLGCVSVDPGDGVERVLTEEAVRPWAGPAVRASLFAWSREGQEWLVRYFIGPQG